MLAAERSLSVNWSLGVIIICAGMFIARYLWSNHIDKRNARDDELLARLRQAARISCGTAVEEMRVKVDDVLDRPYDWAANE